jgi:hypothetical protein
MQAARDEVIKSMCVVVMDRIEFPKIKGEEQELIPVQK